MISKFALLISLLLACATLAVSDDSACVDLSERSPTSIIPRADEFAYSWAGAQGYYVGHEQLGYVVLLLEVPGVSLPQYPRSADCSLILGAALGSPGTGPPNQLNFIGVGIRIDITSSGNVTYTPVSGVGIRNMRPFGDTTGYPINVNDTIALRILDVEAGRLVSVTNLRRDWTIGRKLTAEESALPLYAPQYAEAMVLAVPKGDDGASIMPLPNFHVARFSNFHIHSQTGPVPDMEAVDHASMRRGEGRRPLVNISPRAANAFDAIYVPPVNRSR